MLRGRSSLLSPAGVRLASSVGSAGRLLVFLLYPGILGLGVYGYLRSLWVVHSAMRCMPVDPLAAPIDSPFYSVLTGVVMSGLFEKREGGKAPGLDAVVPRCHCS